MAHLDEGLLADLQARGLVSQVSGGDEFAEFLNGGLRTLYCGFDPTADSLHIGSLVPLLTLKRFQQAGHKPILLVGGATGLIGDPSFKAEERKLNTPELVSTWVEKLRTQVSGFVSFDGVNAAEVVNNLDWVGQFSVLDFLRDIGKHFSINAMINKESVKQRIDREGEGISFTEFAYMTLQSYDFAELNKRYSCNLQIGGSDQWGNITGGIDLCRRLNSEQTYGLTMPLVTKTDGTKFGKTEQGTIWLDPLKTSPYAFYQFWRNVADDDVYKFLRYFTFLDVNEITEIERCDAESAGPPQAQTILAAEVTMLVHGADGLAAAQRISEALFSGDPLGLSESDFDQLKQDGISFSQFSVEQLEGPVSKLLVDGGIASGKQIKDALARGGLLVNGESLSPEQNMTPTQYLSKDRALFGRFFLVRLGKKKYHLFERL